MIASAGPATDANAKDKFKKAATYADQIFLRSNDAELSMMVSWSCRENAAVADLDLSVATYDYKGVLMESIDFNNLLASDKSIELKGDSIQSVLGEQTNEEILLDLKMLPKECVCIVFYASCLSGMLDTVYDVNLNLARLKFPDDESNPNIKRTEPKWFSYRFIDSNTIWEGPMPLTPQEEKGCNTFCPMKLVRHRAKSVSEVDRWEVRVERKPFLSTNNNMRLTYTERNILVDFFPWLRREEQRLIGNIRALCAALGSSALPTLKPTFLGGDGLGLLVDDFVRELFFILVVDRKELQKEKEANHVVGLLYELFNQIDVNGDGHVDWEEFTNYCIEEGVQPINGGSDENGASMAIEYVEEEFYAKQQERDFPRAANALQILNLPFSKRLLLVEEDSHFFKVFTRRGRYIEKKNASCILLHDPRKIHRAEWIPEENLIVVSCDDQTLSLVLEKHDGQNPEPKGYFCVGNVITNTVHRQLLWSSPAKALLTTGVDDLVYVWHIGDKQTLYSDNLAHSNTSAFASDPSNDITVQSIENDSIHARLVNTWPTTHGMVMATCRLKDKHLIALGHADGTISLWTAEDFRKKEVLKWHTKGIRCMVYTHNFLVSVGFETSAIVWDVSGKEICYILKGHRKPLVAATFFDKFAPENLQIATVDEFGEVKLWDIMQGDGSDCEVLNFFVPNIDEKRPMRCIAAPQHADCTLKTFSNLLFGSARMIHFIPRKKQGPFFPPRFVLFNPTFRRFSVCLKNDIHFWDLNSGEYTRSLTDITPANSGITAGCLDRPRNRRLILGDERGRVLLCNLINGHILTEGKFHDAEVTTLTFCDVTSSIISTGGEGRLCIINESSGSLILMRSLDWCHQGPIISAAYSQKLSCVATVGADAKCQVWDFQSVCIKCNTIFLNAQLTAVTIIESHSLVITGDDDGRISVWQISVTDGWSRFLKYLDITNGGYVGEVKVTLTPITSLAYHDGEDKEYLVSINQQGFMGVWKLDDILADLEEEENSSDCSFRPSSGSRNKRLPIGKPQKLSAEAYPGLSHNFNSKTKMNRKFIQPKMVFSMSPLVIETIKQERQHKKSSIASISPNSSSFEVSGLDLLDSLFSIEGESTESGTKESQKIGGGERKAATETETDTQKNKSENKSKRKEKSIFTVPTYIRQAHLEGGPITMTTFVDDYEEKGLVVSAGDDGYVRVFGVGNLERDKDEKEAQNREEEAKNFTLTTSSVLSSIPEGGQGEEKEREGEEIETMKEKKADGEGEVEKKVQVADYPDDLVVYGEVEVPNLTKLKKSDRATFLPHFDYKYPAKGIVSSEKQVKYARLLMNEAIIKYREQLTSKASKGRTAGTVGTSTTMTSGSERRGGDHNINVGIETASTLGFSPLVTPRSPRPNTINIGSSSPNSPTALSIEGSLGFSDSHSISHSLTQALTSVEIDTLRAEAMRPTPVAVRSALSQLDEADDSTLRESLRQMVRDDVDAMSSASSKAADKARQLKLEKDQENRKKGKPNPDAVPEAFSEQSVFQGFEKGLFRLEEANALQYVEKHPERRILYSNEYPWTNDGVTEALKRDMPKFDENLTEDEKKAENKKSNKNLDLSSRYKNASHHMANSRMRKNPAMQTFANKNRRAFALEKYVKKSRFDQRPPIWTCDRIVLKDYQILSKDEDDEELPVPQQNLEESGNMSSLVPVDAIAAHYQEEGHGINQDRNLNTPLMKMKALQEQKEIKKASSLLDESGHFLPSIVSGEIDKETKKVVDPSTKDEKARQLTDRINECLQTPDFLYQKTGPSKRIPLADTIYKPKLESYEYRMRMEAKNRNRGKATQDHISPKKVQEEHEKALKIKATRKPGDDGLDIDKPSFFGPHYTLHDVKRFRDLYNTVDEDLDGEILLDEWEIFLKEMDPTGEPKLRNKLFLSVDSDRDGFIAIEELIPIMFSHATRKQQAGIKKYLITENQKMFIKDTYRKEDLLNFFQYYDDGHRGVINMETTIKACKAIKLPEEKIEIVKKKWSNDEKFLIGRNEFCELLWPHVCPDVNNTKNKGARKKSSSSNSSSTEGKESKEKTAMAA